MRDRLARVAPFIAVNCAGLTETLLESELFGHVKGSFTGAYRDKPGKLQLANKGTLFLDEVGEMSLRMQALLLRFLENGEIQAVGADHARSTVDVRVVAATNRNLADMVANGQFREDLLYRLRVIHIHVPPLRERKEDVRVLVEYFASKAARPVSFSDEALRTLERYRWPGNIRELQNVVEQALWMANGSVVEVSHLPPGRAGVGRSRPANQGAPQAGVRRAVSGARVGRLFLLGTHPSAVPAARRDAARRPRAGAPRALDDAWELSIAAAAVWDAGVGLQAVPEFPGGARLQRRFPRLPQRHGADRADARATAAAATAGRSGNDTRATAPIGHPVRTPLVDRFEVNKA